MMFFPFKLVVICFFTLSGTVTASNRATRAVTKRTDRLWKHRIIPYKFDDIFSGAQISIFRQAMRVWENHTCLVFIDRDPNLHRDYLFFTSLPCGCCSHIGRKGGGAQKISIGEKCDTVGIVVHELGHTIGFWHEHTRPDRDDNVKILWENILPARKDDFNKLSPADVATLGLPYDYKSIMHYSSRTFSKTSYLNTIIPRRSNIRPEDLGQRVGLSPGDIEQTNRLYNCNRCGRTLLDDFGSFSSPLIEINSSNDTVLQRCEWRISTSNGDKIVLNLSQIDIFITQACKMDYLEIRDGYWFKSNLLGRFCGKSKIPRTVVSTGSRMYISYTATKNQIGRQGFKASYKAICGGKLMAQDGTHLESPNFPNYYCKNKACEWTIEAANGYNVALYFNMFDIESDINCAYDYLEIRNGPDIKAPLIGRFCGNQLPPPIVSTGTFLYLRFESDETNEKPGFSATYVTEIDECATERHSCEQSCINTLGSYKCSCDVGYKLEDDGRHCSKAICGGVLNNTFGLIASPGYPNPYPLEQTCSWEITAPKLHKIAISFMHFDLEGSEIWPQECSYDRVDIFSVIDGNTLKNHGSFCGSRSPPTIISESDTVRILFKSDKTQAKTGFQLRYFADMNECAVFNGGCQHDCIDLVGSFYCKCRNGYRLLEDKKSCKPDGCFHEITKPFGKISSPRYPENYRRSSDCVWHFYCTPGHRVKLIFKTFDVEFHEDCIYDRVEVFDGNSTSNTLLGKFCGEEIPESLISSTNEMYLTFTSDGTGQRQGFVAYHSTVCGGHFRVTNESKFLVSHPRFGSKDYRNDYRCAWILEAEPEMKVKLEFSFFMLEFAPDCEYDFVEIHDGPFTENTFKGRFCGYQKPEAILSEYETVKIFFKTDSSHSDKGFSISYTAEPVTNDENKDESHGFYKTKDKTNLKIPP